jgi:predicted cytidylate kinase
MLSKTKPLPDVITISGLAGTGKSTVAKLLAKKIKYQRINSGDIARNLAKEAKLDLITFCNQNLHDSKIDTLIDKKTLEHAKQKHVLLEARLSGWMLYKHKIPALKIWLQAPLKVRAMRTMRREKSSLASSMRHIRQRDTLVIKAYKKHYGIDLNNTSIYDVVIDSMHMTPKQIVDFILKLLSSS